jgi:DNA-binding response OmpR family regulator
VISEVAMPLSDKIKILIIDDEKLICSSIKHYLERDERYSVDTVFRGDDALMKLGNNNYDLILTDLNLPDFKEFELVEEIRSRGIAMPLLTMSANFPDAKELYAVKNHIFKCIPKPFELDEIRNSVAEAVKYRFWQ